MWLSLILCSLAAEPTPAQPPASALTPELGVVLVDTRLPAEIRLDATTIAQLFQAGKLEFPATAGPHTITAIISGAPQQLEIQVPPPGRRAVVLVGRTGLTARAEDLPASDASIVPVEIRTSGEDTVSVRIDDKKWELWPGRTLQLDLAPGPHSLSVRNRDGTVIWASGTLSLVGGEPVIVQLSEGRMPEVSGAGSRFSNGG